MTANDSLILTVTRHFEAPAERVFDAWITPEIASRWLFATPSGTVVRSDIDARVGGKFVVVDRRGEEDAEHTGEYLEVERPRRLVFLFSAGAEPTRVEIEIVPDGAGCLLTLTHAMAAEWADYREQTLGGWTMMLDHLGEILPGNE
jgi:uncharacterized protein YndB with AHSA1/START domain